jgi:chromosome segregation ATPase
MKITHTITHAFVPELSIQNPCNVTLRSTTSAIKSLSIKLDQQLLELEKQFEHIQAKYEECEKKKNEITIDDIQSLLSNDDQEINTQVKTEEENENPYAQQLDDLGDRIVKIKKKIESNNYKLESFGSEAPEFSTHINEITMNDKMYETQLLNKKMRNESRRIQAAIDTKQSKMSIILTKEAVIRTQIQEIEKLMNDLSDSQEKKLYNKYKTAFNSVTITDGYDPQQLDIIIKPLLGKQQIVHVDKDVEVKNKIEEVKTKLNGLNSELKAIRTDMLQLNKQPLSSFYPKPKGLVVIRKDNELQNLPTDKTWLYNQLKSQLNHALKSLKKQQSKLQIYRNQQSVINEAQQIKKTQGDLAIQQQKLEDIKINKQEEIEKIKSIKRNRREIMNNMRDKIKEKFDKRQRNLDVKQKRIDYKYNKLENAYQKFHNNKDKFYQKKNDMYDKMKRTNERVKQIKQQLQYVKDKAFDKRNEIKQEALKYIDKDHQQEFHRNYHKIVHGVDI